MPVNKFGESAGSSGANTGGQFSTAGLVRKTGDTMQGILSAGGFKLINVGTPAVNTDAATKGYVDSIDQDKLPLSGGTLTGDLLFTTAVAETERRLGGMTNSALQMFKLFLGDSLNRIEHTDNPSATRGVVLYSAGGSFRVKVDDVLICAFGIANFGYMTEFQKPIAMANNAITDVANPTDPQDVATKNYVDTLSKPLFEAYQTTTQTISANVFTAVAPFQTKTFDTNNVFVESTGVFTCTAAGYYFVHSCVTFISTSTTYYGNTWIYKNGTQYRQISGDGSNGTSYVNGSGSILVQLNTGDTIKLYAFASQGMGITCNTFSVVKQ